MYKHTELQFVMPDDFFLPFGGKLNKENRWVQLAFLIPWWKIEAHYASQFEPSHTGEQAMSVRVALGALIIQQRLHLSDRETVQQITENPYLQYFIGLPQFQENPPFHPSSLVHFRKRFPDDVINQVNDWIIAGEDKNDDPKARDGNGENADKESDHDNGLEATNVEVVSPSEPENEATEDAPNQGKLLLDATCTPADIAYPTDLSLLNEAREKLEHFIDLLHAPLRKEVPKPRTYREVARKAYLTVAKQRRASERTIRKAVGQQLRFVDRDLRIVEKLKEQVGLTALSARNHKLLLVISELYRQQKEMHSKRIHRIEDRIVNLSQPHVRPIVRGKAKAAVEFGAKVSISVVDGFARMESLQWDSYNEGTTLKASVERYRERYGCYPEAVLADKIYRTRENLQYCKTHGIRLSGPALGRPAKEERKEQRRQARIDAAERNAVEGKFGEGKRIYGLGLIKARLANTSATVIAVQLLVMNLERRLRLLFCRKFCPLFLILREEIGLAV